MKKSRKNNKRVTPEEEPTTYFNRQRIILHGLAVDFTTPSNECKFGIVCTSQPTSTESLSFEIRFNPPLEKIHASSSSVSIMHIESKRNDTRIFILPSTNDKKLQGNYILLPTHVIKLDQKLDKIEIMYLSLQNCQLRGDVGTPIWEPVFNMRWFLNKELDGRFKALDIVMDQSEEHDVSKIPQGSALLGKQSGGITSSRVAKLVGYYPGRFEAIVGWKAVAVRFGKIYENVAMMMYMKKHADRVFHEVGFMSLEGSLSGLDGAMCDGIISEVGAQRQRSSNPSESANSADSAESAQLGSLRYPIELKCSRSSCNFESSHIAQCIWELACGFPHIDLVRFCERQAKDTNSQTWSTVYECKEIRIYRDLEREAELIKLCKQSNLILKNDFNRFTELMQTPPYVKMRGFLDKMAAECNEKAQIVPVDADAIQRLVHYKKNVLDIQDLESFVLHPILDRIEKRQARIFAAYQEEDKSDFIRETMSQMQDYGELVKSEVKSEGFH